MTVAPVRGIAGIKLGKNGKLTGSAAHVPFARDAQHIAVIARRGDDIVIALVERGKCAIKEGRSLADEPKDTVTFEGVEPLAVADAPDGLDVERIGCEAVQRIGRHHDQSAVTNGVGRQRDDAFVEGFRIHGQTNHDGIASRIHR